MAPDKNPDKELELLDHLGELRTRLIRIILYLTVGMAATWVFFDPLYSILLAPAIKVLQGTKTNFLMTSFVQGFTLRVQVALIGGAVLTAPLWTMELWMFVAPGMTKSERKALYFVAPLSIFLFALGVTICYLGMPRALGWFASLTPPSTDLRPDIGRTLIFIVQMYLAFGLMFEMPVVLMFLGKIGIVNSRMMVRLWKEATVAIAFLAALATPSADAFTMLLMAGPMVLLYFLSIFLVRAMER